MYNLSKMLKKYFGSITRPGFGTIQPALKRLEKQGLVKTDKFFTEGGKPYYYYSITQEGKDALIGKIVSKPSNNPTQLIPESRIKVACSDILSQEERTKLFKSIKNLLTQVKTETENVQQSEAFGDNIYAKFITDNTVCEYKNLIDIIERLDNAGNR